MCARPRYNSGIFTTLDVPNALCGTNLGTFATGINDAGQVVGYYYAQIRQYRRIPAHPIVAGATDNRARFGVTGCDRTPGRVCNRPFSDAIQNTARRCEAPADRLRPSAARVTG